MPIESAPRVRSSAWTVLAFAAVVAGSESAAAQRLPVERSVVRIVNHTQRADWKTPWTTGLVRRSEGSGFIIKGGLILTNAHVVSDSKYLVVFVHGDPDPHPAEVAHVAHDADLALIAPQDGTLLAGLPGLTLGGLPDLGSTVETFGFAAGGSELSFTRGVVSRIEAQSYVHSGADRHLIGQTDAAINPGSSGGPVVQDGRVIGVAFQQDASLESVGYFIPMEVVGRFLRDVEDGRYDGYPDLGVETSSLNNPAPRSRAGMEPGESGVIVESVRAASSAEGRVRVGDILLRVDGKTIANDGSISDDRLRLPYGMLVDRKMLGETTKLSVLREMERLDVAVPLKASSAIVRHSNAHDRLPRYYLFGGLVFLPLELETMKTFGANWPTSADKGMIHEFLFRPEAEPAKLDEERVVLLRRLDHPVNAGMAWYRNLVVERVNGRAIRSLEELIETIETSTADDIVLEFSTFRRIGVIDRRAAEQAGPEILRRYGIEKDRRL